MSIDRGMDKEDVVHIYDVIPVSHKKEWNNAICSNVDGREDDHTKWNKSDKKDNIKWDHLYVESKKWYKWTYLQNKQTLKTNMIIKRERWGGKDK